MKRYAAKKRYRCSCCQWEDDKATARSAERLMIRRELEEYQESLEVESKVGDYQATNYTGNLGLNLESDLC